jgi:tetratricopeptide (TPR) repeat protein
MRAVFGAMLRKATVNLPIPLQIVAFRNTKEFRQFTPLWHGKPTELSGLFQGGEDREFILLDMSVEDPWTVVFHEYAHQLLNGNLKGQIQPWFDEGFAEYFSTIQVDGNKVKLGYRAPPGYVEALRQLGLMKVSELFSVQHSSKTYNEGDRRSLFYAESWLIVHYLYGTQQVSKLGPYFDAIDQKLSVEEAIQKGFGISAAQLDKNLRTYLATNGINYITIPTPAIETGRYSVSPMTSAEAKAVMADVHLHSLDYLNQAVNEFEAILAAEPDNAAALRGLGYAALRNHDFDRAGNYFRKAVQADSKDPRVYYYSALLGSDENALVENSQQLDRIKKDLEKSIMLDPGFADAHSQLAIAHMRAGEKTEAIAAMKKAIELSPRNEQYQFNLSQMYLTTGEVESATTILRALSDSPDPAMVEKTRQAIEQVNKMQAVLHAMSNHSQGTLVNATSTESGAAPAITGHADQAELQPPPPKFLKGQLMSVDCSNLPAAVLTVVAGPKTFKMNVADTKRVAVIGADIFSCTWSKVKVALNYHELPNGEANVMSVEIQ